MSLKKTVISHFYNEEYLMPWWLDHHRTMFDHGIMIDYKSTDASREIIKAHVPNWDILDSRNNEFSAIACDKEVMDIERSISGWKIALNTTEFLCCENLDAILNQAERQKQTCLQSHGIIMVDPLDCDLPEPTKSSSLITQRHFGFFEKEAVLDFLGFPSRCRLLHCRDHGAYRPGRHQSDHADIIAQEDLFVLWFGFSPWNDRTISRKLGIKARIPEEDRRMGLGFHHLVEFQQLESMRRAEGTKAKDLRMSSSYRRATQSYFQQATPTPALNTSATTQSR